MRAYSAGAFTAAAVWGKRAMMQSMLTPLRHTMQGDRRPTWDTDGLRRAIAGLPVDETVRREALERLDIVARERTDG